MLSGDDLTALLDPTTYVGRGPEIVDSITGSYGVEEDGTDNAYGGGGAGESKVKSKSVDAKSATGAATGGGGTES